MGKVSRSCIWPSIVGEPIFCKNFDMLRRSRLWPTQTLVFVRIGTTFAWDECHMEFGFNCVSALLGSFDAPYVMPLGI